MPVPICLIVDDPAPLVNVYWWHAARQPGTGTPVQQSGEPVAPAIPGDFLDRFVEIVQRWGVRGKFTVLPWPAGLGPIDRGWPGCDLAALSAWLETARRGIAPSMDITPEILTHARAVDLSSMSLLAESEREWATHQTAATLTPYIALALEILQRVGLPATGVTSPWDFGTPVEDEYRTAIRQAMAQVTGSTRAWYFLHSDTAATELRSQVVRRDDDGWLVSIWAQVGDHLWQTMETAEEGQDLVARIAAAYLTEDGGAGRLAQLYAAGTPMVLCTHWQSLYSNGRRTGLRVLEEVCRRIHATWGPRVAWTRCSELAAMLAEGSTT